MKRNSLLALLVALIAGATNGQSAESAAKPPAEAAPSALVDFTPSDADKPAPGNTTQQTLTFSSGAKTARFTSVRAVFSERAQGFIYTYQTRGDEEFLAGFNLYRDLSRSDDVAAPGALAIRIVARREDFTPMELHSDAKVTSVHGTSTETLVLIEGRFSLLAIIPALQGSRKKRSYSLIGTPGTALDLSPLRETGDALPLFGQDLSPAGPGPAIVRITPRAIELFNVKYQPAPKTTTGK